MDAIRKKMEYHAKLRALGCFIRFHDLDKDGDETNPEREALASSLVKDHSEKDVKEALGFVAYLNAMTDPSCSVCKGIGVVSVPNPVSGDDKPFYEPCYCARQSEKKRQAERPVFVVKGTREADLDKRIAEVEKHLESAIKRRDEAVKPVVEELRAIDLSVQTYKKERSIYEDKIEDFALYVKNMAEDIVELRERLDRANVQLAEFRAGEAQCKEDLAKFDEDNSKLTESVAEIKAKHDRVARHHTPKIEKAEKTLRRLKYLRGDAPTVISKPVAAADVSVVFKEAQT